MRALWRVARMLPVVGMGIYMRRTIRMQEDNQQQGEVYRVEALLQKPIENVETQDKPEQLKHEEKEEEHEKQLRKIENDSNQSQVHEQNSIVQIDKISQQQSKETMQTTEQPQNQQTEIENTQQQITRISIDQLQPNQVLVGTNCPPDLLKYLKLSPLQVVESGQTSTVTIKNQRGDLYTFDPEQQFIEVDQKQLLANFINPPRPISTIQEAQQLLTLLQRQDFAVLTYIPQQKYYEELMNKRITSEFDQYSKRHRVDLQAVERQFVEVAYKSSSNRDCYLIIRSKDVADYLKLNTFAIGQQYILTLGQPGESNLKLSFGKYRILQTSKHPFCSLSKNQNKPNTIDINKLTHMNLNKIDSEAELYNKIRQMQMAKDHRKILLFYTDEKRQQFHQKTEQLLEKVGQVQCQQVVVIKCSNPEAMRRVLAVEPDPFATIRLIDPHTLQQPLFGQTPTRPIFSRRKYKGPFQLEPLCKFVASTYGQEHIESKGKLTSVKTARPNELINRDKTVVLMQKEGCQGCRYVGESMEQLKRVIKVLRDGGRKAKQLTYRYSISDANLLSRITLRRYNILNDSDNQHLKVNSTPRLYLWSDGLPLDLHVEHSLKKLNQTNPEGVHDAVLADIIERIINKARFGSEDD